MPKCQCIEHTNTTHIPSSAEETCTDTYACMNETSTNMQKCVYTDECAGCICTWTYSQPDSTLCYTDLFGDYICPSNSPGSCLVLSYSSITIIQLHTSYLKFFLDMSLSFIIFILFIGLIGVSMYTMLSLKNNGGNYVSTPQIDNRACEIP